MKPLLFLLALFALFFAAIYMQAQTTGALAGRIVDEIEVILPKSIDPQDSFFMPQSVGENDIELPSHEIEDVEAYVGGSGGAEIFIPSDICIPDGVFEVIRPKIKGKNPAPELSQQE